MYLMELIYVNEYAATFVEPFTCVMVALHVPPHVAHHANDLGAPGRGPAQSKCNQVIYRFSQERRPFPCLKHFQINLLYDHH